MRLPIVALVVSLSGAASAGESGREQFAAGQEAFQGGRCEEAARRFALGYRLEPLPGFLFNEALARRCLFDAGHDPEQARRAITLFHYFLAAAPPFDPKRRDAAIAANELIHALPPAEQHAPLTLMPAPAPPRETASALRLAGTDAQAERRPERLGVKPLSRKAKIAIGVSVSAVLVACFATALGVGLYTSDKNQPTVMPRW